MGLGSRIRDPRSGIRDPEKTHSGSRIPDPGVKKAPDPRSRIPDPDPDPQHCRQVLKNFTPNKYFKKLKKLLPTHILLIHYHGGKTRLYNFVFFFLTRQDDESFVVPSACLSAGRKKYFL
jgi:hypothetical protein